MHPKVSGGPVRVVACALALVVVGSAATVRVTVARGDTLSSLAQRYHTTVSALSAANGLADPNRIQAGQAIVIPAGSDAPPSAALIGGVRAAGATPTSTAHGLPSLLLAHLDRLKLRPVFQQWSVAFGVPAGLVEAVAWMESGWQNTVVSPTGAVGIGQLEPSTVAFVSGPLLHVALNPKVAGDNIRMTARYLRWLLDNGERDVAEALGGYYQGLASIDGRGPLAETQSYVSAVLGLWTQFGRG